MPRSGRSPAAGGEEEDGAAEVRDPAHVGNPMGEGGVLLVARFTRVGCTSSAALRAAVPAGGRRSKPSPRFFSLGETRPPPACGWAVPAGGRRSKPSPRFFSLGETRLRPPAAGCADRRSAFQAVPATDRRRGLALGYEAG